MTNHFASLDQRLESIPSRAIFAAALVGVALIGLVDFLTGYEVSMSVFYLGPVILAARYAGGRAGMTVAVLSCIAWYAAELAAGHPYSHPGIPVWNALVRLVFFVGAALMLKTLRDSLAEQRRLARTDSLTELFTRREFEERLKHDFALMHRRNSAVTLAYVDIDDFKAVNDTYGHAEGDRILQTVARTVRGSIRETDTAARLGGDEFALLFPDTDARAAQRVMGNLARKLELALRGPSRVTCSIGVVTFPGAIGSPASAVATADKLMYEVKRSGKGAISFNVCPHSDAPPVESEVSKIARS
jgi:diguanylate cyclase (GGDEF)-like protein